MSNSSELRITHEPEASINSGSDDKNMNGKDGVYTTDVTVSEANQGPVNDAVFGNINEDGPNYRNVGWLGTAVLMTKTQIGLGVLGIPYVLHTLGLVPGIICLLAVASITTWSDYVVGTFKLKHPEVYGVDDVGFLLIRDAVGREIIGAAFWLFMTFVTGSGLLGISIGLNAISEHGTCTAVFVVVAAVVTFCLASVQTLGKISWLGWIGMASILSALLTLTISVGVQDRPAEAPQVGSWDKGLVIWGKPSFTDAISAVSTLVFSFAGTPGFFGIVSEMKNPRLYTRSMLLCQSVVTMAYLTIGIIVYCFCGIYVASPALGSAGGLMKKVCYGLALPGLFITATIYTHLPAKYVFLRVMRGSEHLTRNSFKHYVVWFSCVAGCVLFSYIVASAIPVFGGLVGLIGALFGTLLSMQLMGGMWLYDNWQHRQTKKTITYKFLLGFNIFVIVIGTFLMIAGTYGSIVGIIASSKASGGGSPWSCADNSK
ncbi:hypothetical protein I302_106384 [Kwoniella bestiolae CBS 10118]|uniref:Amino acid transporter transmembrane domain-containing protein n=1 Tax=Kwoniella bestiolae CBS 10118 TaxID=1296100 RepID=A0A1B9G3T1_9TREE|nr:hypothetical protein I302_05508 [Kwoniella bestiolae CBS 10118]OCF25684.1 hypothetical protein I302_05508 [Kwoniella bestiolae CBS 10118]